MRPRMDQQSTGIVVTGASGRMGRMLVREVAIVEEARDGLAMAVRLRALKR